MHHTTYTNNSNLISCWFVKMVSCGARGSVFVLKNKKLVDYYTEPTFGALTLV